MKSDHPPTHVPPPVATRTRTVDDLLQPGDQELILNAMVQLAIIQVGDPPWAERDARAYLKQLTKKGLPTDGLHDFTADLFTHPAGFGWRKQLAQQLATVEPARCRIWLSLQSVWGIDDLPVSGPEMRRVDAILDLADLPASALDIQVAAAEYATCIAEAKVSRAMDAGLILAVAVASGAAAMVGESWTGGRLAIGASDHLRRRLATIDSEARTLAQLVLAADAAAINQDGGADVERMRDGLREDLTLARRSQPAFRPLPDQPSHAARTEMMQIALEVLSRIAHKSEGVDRPD